MYNHHIRNLYIYFVILQARKYVDITPEIGILLYHLSSKIKAQILDKISFLSKFIAEKKLDTVQRLDAALNYILSNLHEEINISTFEEACGIGIVVLPEQIEEEVEKLINTYKKEILEKRL